MRIIKRIAVPGVLSVACSLQPAISQAMVLEEITVTAQKRKETAQDVGLSITAFTGDQLTKLGYNSSEDVVAQAPGVSFDFGSFSIRGVTQTDFVNHQEAPNAVYFDGVYVSDTNSVTFQTFDLERIEVLKGPQGTLFGRNATGGLAQYISKKPTEEFEAYVEGTVGSYNTRRIEGAFGGRIPDTLQARLSFLSNDRDGFVENRTGKDFNDADELGGRLQLYYAPTETFNALLSIRAGESDTRDGWYIHGAAATGADGLAYAISGPDDYGFEDSDNPHKVSHNEDGFREYKNLSTSLTMNWDTELGQITSVTDHSSADEKYLEDTDASPAFLFSYFTDSESQQFSQEFRLDVEREGYSWTAGLYYLEIDGEHDTVTSYGPELGPFDHYANHELETKTWSVFGQAYFDLTDQLRLITGLRWTEEEKEFSFASDADGFGPLIVFDKASVGSLAEQDEGDWSGKVALEWRPGDTDVLYYASVSRGTKAGGFNAPVSSFTFPTNLMPFDGETLTAYEVGFKSRLLEDTAILNASVFYYDYKDFQSLNLVDFSNLVFNRDAEVQGVEVEFRWQPTDRFYFSLAGTYLDAKVFDVNTTAATTFSERDMPSTPEWEFSGLARYSLPVLSGNLAIQLDTNYVDSRFLSIQNHPLTEQDSTVVSNLRLSYAPESEKWEVALLARNITDEEVANVIYDLSAYSGASISRFAEPRWFGATFRYNWGE